MFMVKAKRLNEIKLPSNYEVLKLLHKFNINMNHTMYVTIHTKLHQDDIEFIYMRNSWKIITTCSNGHFYGNTEINTLP